MNVDLLSEILLRVIVFISIKAKIIYQNKRSYDDKFVSILKVIRMI